MIFRQALLRLEQELDVPYPERRELLDEIASHLDDLFTDAKTAGASEQDASRHALACMAIDGDFVASMNTVHKTAVAKALARLHPSVSLGIEYGLILAVGLFLFTSVLIKEAAMVEFLLSGGVFMIPLNLAGLAILVIAIERGYSLLVKRDHSKNNLMRRLLSLRFLAVACALTGGLGTLIGLFQAFGAAEQIMARHGGQFPLYEVASISMTTSIWGLTLTLLAVTAHFVISAKVQRIQALQLS